MMAGWRSVLTTSSPLSVMTERGANKRHKLFVVSSTSPQMEVIKLINYLFSNHDNLLVVLYLKLQFHMHKFVVF